jgi:hypothetical protein
VAFWCRVRDVATSQLWSAELLLQALHLAGHEDVGVRLDDKDLNHEDNDGADDEDDPKIPAPSDALRDEAPDDGPKGRSWMSLVNMTCLLQYGWSTHQ